MVTLRRGEGWTGSPPSHHSGVWEPVVSLFLSGLAGADQRCCRWDLHVNLESEPEPAWNDATTSQGMLEASRVSHFLTNVTRYLT